MINMLSLANLTLLSKLLKYLFNYLCIYTKSNSHIFSRHLINNIKNRVFHQLNRKLTKPHIPTAINMN